MAVQCNRCQLHNWLRFWWYAYFTGRGHYLPRVEKKVFESTCLNVWNSCSFSSFDHGIFDFYVYRHANAIRGAAHLFPKLLLVVWDSLLWCCASNPCDEIPGHQCQNEFVLRRHRPRKAWHCIFGRVCDTYFTKLSQPIGRKYLCDFGWRN